MNTVVKQTNQNAFAREELQDLFVELVEERRNISNTIEEIIQPGMTYNNV